MRLRWALGRSSAWTLSATLDGERRQRLGGSWLRSGFSSILPTAGGTNAFLFQSLSISSDPLYLLSCFPYVLAIHQPPPPPCLLVFLPLCPRLCYPAAFLVFFLIRFILSPFLRLKSVADGVEVTLRCAPQKLS